MTRPILSPYVGETLQKDLSASCQTLPRPLSFPRLREANRNTCSSRQQLQTQDPFSSVFPRRSTSCRGSGARCTQDKERSHAALVPPSFRRARCSLPALETGSKSPLRH